MSDELFKYLPSSLIKVVDSWAFYIAALGGIGIGAMKVFKKIKDLTHDNFITIHSEIHELLTELRVMSDAARTQVIQFHNGDYFMDGISMRKFSLTHESVEKGIESDADRIQGLMCSVFLPLILAVVEDDPKVRFVADLKESYIKQYLHSRNVEAFSVLPIKIQNNITGFVVIQWCSEIKAEKIDKEFCQKELRKMTNSITVQLTQQKR
jgi:hypothetical protein